MDMNNSRELMKLMLIIEDDEEISVRFKLENEFGEMVLRNREKFDEKAQPFTDMLVDILYSELNEDGTLKSKEEE